MFAPLLITLGAMGIGMAGAATKKRRAKAGGRSPRTPRNIAYGTQVPEFGARVGGGRRRRAGVECPPLPWMDNEINYVIEDAINNKGVLDERVLVLMALHEVYDSTEDGRPLQWPTVPEDCNALKMLQARTQARVRHFLAEIADLEAGMIYEDMR